MYRGQIIQPSDNNLQFINTFAGYRIFLLRRGALGRWIGDGGRSALTIVGWAVIYSCACPHDEWHPILPREHLRGSSSLLIRVDVLHGQPL